MTRTFSNSAGFAGRGGHEGTGDGPVSPSLVVSSQTSPAVEPMAPAGGSLSVEDTEKLQDWLDRDARGSFALAIREIGAYHRAQGTRPIGGYFTQAR